MGKIAEDEGWSTRIRRKQMSIHHDHLERGIHALRDWVIKITFMTKYRDISTESLLSSNMRGTELSSSKLTYLSNK